MPKSSAYHHAVLLTVLAVDALIGVTGRAQIPSLIPQQQAGPLSNVLSTPATRALGAGVGSGATGIVTSPPNFEKLRIQPNFLLHVSLFNEPQLNQDVRVSDTGDINMTLAGPVHVQGMNEAEAQEAIAAAYRRSEMLKNPQVSLSILQYVSPKISVLGQVQSPGEYELIAPTDLLTVLTMAGGATIDAGNRITLRRAGSREDQVIRFVRSDDTSNLQKYTVSAGDTVVVKRAGIVYVLGAVNRPGGYLMQPDGSMNVIQAIALALDTNFYASTQDVRIIRKTDEGILDIPVKYKCIVDGKVSPQALEPDDIVYVPNSKVKVTFANAKQLAFQASGAAIYAGLVR